ncbi:MAG: CAP domain-containing protein, partial [Planctomycetota bacterium]
MNLRPIEPNSPAVLCALHVSAVHTAARWALLAWVLLASFRMRGAEKPEAGVELSAEEKAVCELTNKERKNAGLEPLQLNAKLFEAARAHAANMLKHGKMAHKLDGQEAPQRVAAKGYRYALVGENVAYGQETPEEVVAAWMASPTHRANILRAQFT